MADPFKPRTVSVVIQFYANGGPMNLAMSECDYLDMEKAFYEKDPDVKVYTWRTTYEGGIVTLDLCAIRGILMVEGNKRQASETFDKMR